MLTQTPQEPPAQDRPRASLYTLGCRLNQAETAVLADRLADQGYEIVAFGQPADLVVFNSCSVTADAERDCRYLVRRTLRRAPRAFIAVTGCYAQTGLDALSRVSGIDLILGNQFKMNLPAYLPMPASLAKRPVPTVLHTKRIDRDEFVQDGAGRCDGTRANLKIQDGCSFMCAFCNIPFARGGERSRRFEDALREAEALVARGHRELVLTGVNIGRYESSGRSLLDLIEALERIDGLDRIRLSSIEPTTVPDALLDHMASSAKLCRYLHIPVQSGNDAVLEAMNRHYTARDYAALIERAAGRIPDLGLGTDILVGFPGETDGAFAYTLALAQALPFSYFHVFPYSSRPGTGAIKLAGAVPSKTIALRVAKLADLSRAKRLAYYRRLTGRTVRVLFEAPEPDGLRAGWTDNYVRVGIRTDRDLRNTIADVRVVGAMDGLAVGELAA